MIMTHIYSNFTVTLKCKKPKKNLSNQSFETACGFFSRSNSAAAPSCEKSEEVRTLNAYKEEKKIPTQRRYHFFFLFVPLPFGTTYDHTTRVELSCILMEPNQFLFTSDRNKLDRIFLNNLETARIY